MDIQGAQLDLYPPIQPFETGMLPLDGGHSMYWEQSGNPNGRPVVFVHGGPGAGASPNHRRFFDPSYWRIVVFDQRGAGRSRPYAETKDNTTGHLVADMEALRRHLGIGQWVVFGGSWGASLSLAYGIAHPERCAGVVLRGVFLCRRREVDWFLHGMGLVFPEAHRAFVGFLPEEERGDVLAAYHRRLTDPDPEVHLPAALTWSRYETQCSTLFPPDPGLGLGIEAEAALALARLEAHYFVNDMFMEEGYLLKRIARLRDVPGVIVQGRYDMICPIASADELSRAWPEARYTVVADAGHSVMETGIRRALVAATEGLKQARP